jgi:hypothetical protein
MRGTIPEIDAKGLRNFAFVIGGVVAGLFGVLLPWLSDRPFRTWPWIFLAVFATWGLVLPRSLKPVYKAWMTLGLILHSITTPVIMGAVFFLIFTPVGVVLRIFGWDTLRRRRSSETAAAETYRVPSQSQGVRNMEKPY